MTGISNETNQLLEHAAQCDPQGLGMLELETANGKRYIRTQERLKRVLGCSPGRLGELGP
jgi:hypothetical protein